MNLLEQIKAAGVVGAGGAGFPTHLKLDCKVEYLLVNAAECEPLLYTDKYIMNHYPREVVQAVEAVAAQIGAREAHIAVKGVNTREIASLRGAVEALGSAVRIFELGNYYPAGDEQMIVCDITGRVVPPGGLPLEVGAVVSNVATMLNIHDALEGRPVTHKFLTVTGEVQRPAVLRVPVGISFSECVQACGGPRVERFKTINGGPMMGQVSQGEELAGLYVTKTTSGIILVAEGANFVARHKELSVEKILSRAKSACIQCSFCTDLCPRRLTGHQLRPHMVMRQMAMVDFRKEFVPTEIMEEALACCDCGVCETYACPMGLSPRQVNKYVKSKLPGKRPNRGEEPCAPHPMREYRKVAPRKIMARMGLARLYDNQVDGFHDLPAREVHIPLKQHIGAPSAPVVKIGERVEAGQIIARCAEKGPGANIHASIAGVVAACGPVIVIRGEG